MKKLFLPVLLLLTMQIYAQFTIEENDFVNKLSYSMKVDSIDLYTLSEISLLKEMDKPFDVSIDYENMHSDNMVFLEYSYPLKNTSNKESLVMDLSLNIHTPKIKKIKFKNMMIDGNNSLKMPKVAFRF